MTGSTVRPETDTRQFSFALPTEGQTQPLHGVFFRNEEPVSDMYFSSASALAALDEFVTSDQIPNEHQLAIAEEIRASGLPENEPYIGPFRFETETSGPIVAGFLRNADGICLGEGRPFFAKSEVLGGLDEAIKAGAILPEERDGLIKAINDSQLPENAVVAPGGMFVIKIGGPRPAVVNGPFGFETTQSDGMVVGCVVDKNGKPMSTPYKSKAQAIYEIERSLEKGRIPEEDREPLLKQVADSPLSEGWNLEVLFRMCTSCPAPIPHGYIYIDGGQVGPFASVAEASAAIDEMIRIGVLTEMAAEKIRSDMRSDGLPESIGD